MGIEAINQCLRHAIQIFARIHQQCTIKSIACSMQMLAPIPLQQITNRWRLSQLINIQKNRMHKTYKSCIVYNDNYKFDDMKHIIILGSARSDGNTMQAVNEIIAGKKIPILDLKQHNINEFKYEIDSQNDDFSSIIDNILQYDTFIIATPTYWYSMSAQMKIFFDRLTDLLIEENGEFYIPRFVGKKIFVITSFANMYLKESFEDVFRNICKFLRMEYLGTSFIYKGEDLKCSHATDNHRQIASARQILNIDS